MATRLVIVLYSKVLSMLFRLGFTEVIISDQGREFVNKVNEEFMALAGVMGRPCPIMLQNLPISQVYKSHVFHLLVSRLLPISLNEKGIHLDK